MLTKTANGSSIYSTKGGGDAAERGHTMTSDDVFNSQIVKTAEGGTIDLADVRKAFDAEIVDIDEDGGEEWEEEVEMQDGRHYLLYWYFPTEEIPRDEDGNRLADDGLLPWHKQEYIFKAYRYEYGEDD